MTKAITLVSILALIFLPNVSARSDRSAVFTVTAYCLHGGTATGTQTKRGTIAVDPNVIKLGTNLFVGGYGKGVALDTGSAVKGYHVDVWMDSCADAIRWGTQKRIVRW